MVCPKLSENVCVGVLLKCVIIIMHEGTEGGTTSDTRPARREPPGPTKATGPSKAAEATGATRADQRTPGPQGPTKG